MKNIIKKFYKRLDRFIEGITSGNFRLKVRTVAILTSILIFAVVIISVITAFIEFEITVPAVGQINRMINETVVEFKVLVNRNYRTSVEIGQKVKIWILNNGRTLLHTKITKIEEIEKIDGFYVYLENITPIFISENLINQKVKGKIVVDKKRVHKLLLK